MQIGEKTVYVGRFEQKGERQEPENPIYNNMLKKNFDFCKIQFKINQIDAKIRFRSSKNSIFVQPRYQADHRHLLWQVAPSNL